MGFKPSAVNKMQARVAAKVSPREAKPKPLKPKPEPPKEDVFVTYLLLNGLPEPKTEYRFCPERKWRADYCWPDYRVVLEIEGGVFTGGRHTRGGGFLGDIEKYNEAGRLGYRIFRATPTAFKKRESAYMYSAELLSLLKEVLK